MIKAMLNFKCGMGRLCVCVCRRREGAGKGREGDKERGGGGRRRSGGPGPGCTGSGPVHTSWFWPGAGHCELPHLSFLLRNENHGPHLLRRTEMPHLSPGHREDALFRSHAPESILLWVQDLGPHSLPREPQTALHTEDTFAARLCCSPPIFFKCLHHRTSCLFWTFWCFQVFFLIGV